MKRDSLKHILVSELSTPKQAVSVGLMVLTKVKRSEVNLVIGLNLQKLEYYSLLWKSIC